MRRLIMIVVAVLTVVVVLGMLALVPRAGAAERPVSARVWAQRVCTAVLPAAEQLGEDFAVAAFPSEAPTSTEEAIARVAQMGVLVADLEGVLVAMRDGVTDAGLPRIAKGQRTVRLIVNDIDEVVAGLRTVREEFDRFAVDAYVEPVPAAERVADVMDRYLTREAIAPLVEHWPAQLRRALDTTPECAVLASVLAETTAAL